MLRPLASFLVLLSCLAPVTGQELLAGDADSWDYHAIFEALAARLDAWVIDGDADAERELSAWVTRIRAVSEAERDARQVDPSRLDGLIRQTVRGDARLSSASLEQVREARLALLAIFADEPVSELRRKRDGVFAGRITSAGVELVTVEFRAEAGIEEQAMERLAMLGGHHHELASLIEDAPLWESSTPRLYGAYREREEELREAIEGDLNYLVEYYHLLRRTLSRKRDSVDGAAAIDATTTLLDELSQCIRTRIEPSFTRSIGMRNEPVKELFWLQDHPDYQLLDEICKRGNLASLGVRPLLDRAEAAMRALSAERFRTIVNTPAVPRRQLEEVVEPLGALFDALDLESPDFVDTWKDELERLDDAIPWKEVFPVLQLPAEYTTQYRELELVCGELASRSLGDEPRYRELARFLQTEAGLLSERLDELYGPENGEPRVAMHPLEVDPGNPTRSLFFLASMYRMFVDLKVQLQIERGVVIYGDIVFDRIEKALVGMGGTLLESLSLEWDAYFAEAERLLALESRDWEKLLPAFLSQSLDKYAKARARVERRLEILASLDGMEVSRDWVREALAEQQRRFQRLVREAAQGPGEGLAAELREGFDRARFKLVAILQERVSDELEAAGFPVRLATSIAQDVGLDAGEMTVMLPSTLDRALATSLRRVENQKLATAYAYEDGLRSLAEHEQAADLVAEIAVALDYVRLEQELRESFAAFDPADFLARYEELVLANGEDLIASWRRREIEGAGQSWLIDVSGPAQILLERLPRGHPSLERAHIELDFGNQGGLVLVRRGERYSLGMGAVGAVFENLRVFLGAFRNQLGEVETGPFGSETEDPIEARLIAWFEQDRGRPLFTTYFAKVGPGNLVGAVHLVGISAATRGPITFEERWSSDAQVTANLTGDGAIEWRMEPRVSFADETCSFRMTGAALELVSPTARAVLLGGSEALVAGRVEVVETNVPGHGTVLLLVPLVVPVDLETGALLALEPFRDATTPWAIDPTWLGRLGDPKQGFLDMETGAFKIDIQLSVDNPKALADVAVPVQVAGIDEVERSGLEDWEFHWFIEDHGRRIGKLCGAGTQALVSSSERGSVIVYCIGLGPNGERAAGDEAVTFQEDAASPIVFRQLWISEDEPIKGQTTENRVDFAPGQTAYLCVRFETEDVPKADLYFEVESKGRTIESLSTQRTLRNLENGLHEEVFRVVLPRDQAKFSGELIFKSTITRYEGSRTISDSKTAPHTFRIWNPLKILAVNINDGQTTFEEWERLQVGVEADAGDIAGKGQFTANIRVSVLDSVGEPVPGMSAEETLTRLSARDVVCNFEALPIPPTFVDNELCTVRAELTVGDRTVTSEKKVWIIPKVHIDEIRAEEKGGVVELTAIAFVLVRDGERVLVTRRIFIDGVQVDETPARVRRFSSERPMETRFTWQRPPELTGEIPYSVRFDVEDGRSFEKSGKILIRRE